MVNAQERRGRTLISHEWIESTGGSENVFKELLEAFPDADACCLWNNVPDQFDRPVTESRLASSSVRGRKALSLPFQPKTWRDWNLDGYDTVLSSSHAFGHHLATHAAKAGRRSFAYVHTPARYVWAPEVEQRGRGAAVRIASQPLKWVDRRATHPGVQYVANSEYIRDRVRRAWGREAHVIYPPVEVAKLQSVPQWADLLDAETSSALDAIPAGGFILGASRLVHYKRLDLVMAVAENLGVPAVIAGAGPAEAQLKARAAELRIPVIFTGRVSDEALFALYQQALLYIFLPVEDFGIMPVEAMALGTPVLVNSQDGASESVTRVNGGLSVDGTSSLAEMSERAQAAMSLNMSEAKVRVNQFSKENFRRSITDWIGTAP